MKTFLIFCLIITTSILLEAQDRIAGHDFATRSEIIARNGMAATSQPLATQTALDILKKGGNAIDAAIAANAVLGVTEPTGAGIGGDIFAIIWSAEKHRLYGLNGSGRSPRSLKLEYFLVVFIAITAFSCSSPAKRAEKRLNLFMEKSKTVGLSVAVVKNNTLIYTGAFGKSSIENNVSLTTDDIFRIASISKSFTTTAILTLVEKGDISPDTDVNDIIGFKVRNPDFPDVPITIKMLLSHSSSLNDSQGYFTLDYINPDINPDYARSYNDYLPGTGYQYCNLGFNTLGAIIEKVSAIRFDKYISQNILQPLNLKASFNVNDFSNNTFATLYTSDTTGFASTGKIIFKPSESAYQIKAADIDPASYVIGYSAPLFSPTGGMKISAPDLARYMIMHMNYGLYPQSGVRIIKEGNSKLMQIPVIATGEERSYCMGLNISSNLIPGEKMTGHTGSAYGLFSAMYFEPEKKFGIVTITNGTSTEYGSYVDGFAPVQRDVVRILYDEFIK